MKAAKRKLKLFVTSGNSKRGKLQGIKMFSKLVIKTHADD